MKKALIFQITPAQRPYIVGWRFDRIESLATGMVTYRMITMLHFSDVYIH